jgi:hypothetical protein
MVESIREIIGGKTEQETRYYISSLKADAVRRATRSAVTGALKAIAG